MRELIDQSSGFGYFRESNQPHFDVLQIWQDQGTELIAMAHAPILPSLGLSVSFDSQTLHIAPVRDSNLDRILPDLQIEDLRIGKKATENRDFWYPHRSDKEQYVEREDARYVTQQLSPLASYSERHDGIAPKLIAAIIKNEQTYYRVDKDALPDAIIRKTGGFPIDLTVGPAQMRLSNIRNLASKYPELLGSVGDSTHLATDKGYATMLVGAYLDDRIRTLEQWSKIMPERSELTKDERFLLDYALPLWKAGLETKALIMSYNPAGGKDHLDNVLKYLQED